MLEFKSFSEEEIQRAKDHGYIVSLSSEGVMKLEKGDDVFIWHSNGSLTVYSQYYEVTTVLDKYPAEVYLYG